MTIFHHQKEIVTRNYDVAGSGFSPLPNDLKTDNNEIVKLDIATIKNLTSLFLAILTSAIAYGIIAAMVAIKLEMYVKNEVLMSVSSASQIIAGVVFARFLPDVGRKLGLTKTVMLASVLSAISSILLYFYFNYFLWILVIYIYGTSLFICGVTRQTIMIDLAPKHLRAMIISLGGMIVSIGNSLGPILTKLLQTSDSFMSFALAAILFLSSILPLSKVDDSNSQIREEKKIGLWRYIKNSPKIMAAGFCVNYALSSTSAFLIIYGIKVGMGSDSSLLLSVFLFGSIFSIPIAYLVDRLNRRFLMITSATLAIICVLKLLLSQNYSEIYTTIFLMFGCLVGMKLSAVILINDKYKPTQRLAVNSAFSRVSLMGNIVGIFTTGAIMSFKGATGLWLSNFIILNIFLIFCLINYGNKLRKKELKLQDFSIINKRDDVLQT